MNPACLSPRKMPAPRGLQLCLLVAWLGSAAAPGEWIPTNFGIGADAEVRESAPVQNRGASTELAMRVRNDYISGNANDGTDRNSAIYCKFDISEVDPGLRRSITTAFRLTFRNNNLTTGGLSDDVTPNPEVRTGLAVYGLAQHLTWNEGTINYLNAPGITFDGDVETKDFNSDAMFLGTVLLPEIGSQNHLPIGGKLEFRSAALNSFLTGALANGAQELTIICTLLHSGDGPLNLWQNFNYLFNPKDQVTLNADPNYDGDVDDPDNPLGSPYSGAANAGLYSPSLLIQIAGPPPGLSIEYLGAGIAELTLHDVLAHGCYAIERSQTLLHYDWTEVSAVQSPFAGTIKVNVPPFPTLDPVFYRVRKD